MEAAGFEPASRDVSTEASTCVVGDLNFIQSTGHRHPDYQTIWKLYLATRVSNVTRCDLELMTSISSSPAKPVSRGTYYYAAIAKELSSANKVFGQIFTWPSDQPRHATPISHDPVDSNSPPIRKQKLKRTIKNTQFPQNDNGPGRFPNVLTRFL